MTRLTLLAATTLAAAWLAGPAAAQPVSGLYIAGGGGANFMQNQKETFVIGGTSFSQTPLTGGLGVTSALPPTSFTQRRSFDTGFVGVGSVGYGFGNGLRIEVEGDYRQNRISPNGPVERKFGGMFNALFDLDIGSPYVFPYFGGGVGTQRILFKREFFGPYFENDRVNGTTLAYQGIGGLAFPVPYVPGLSLTTEYRFLGLAGRVVERVDSSGGGPFGSFTDHARGRIKNDYNHSLMLGLRYAFNVAPPPALETPAAPPAAMNRTYLVFFDWDRADLTDRARAIIAEAAQASSRAGTTRIEVDGNADRSGTPRYNIGLSQRRAQTVAAELVRDGVSREAITIQAFGDTRPLVPTAAGVREPQNRRVEIILR